MKIAIRGVPNFSFVEIREVSDIEYALSCLDLRVRKGVFGAQYEYFLRHGNWSSRVRVIVYIQAIEENTLAIERMCISRDGTGRALSCGRISIDGNRIKTAGSASYPTIIPGETNVYISVNPERDVRYAELSANYRTQLAADEKKHREEQSMLAEQEEELLDTVDQLKNKYSHADLLARFRQLL